MNRPASTPPLLDGFHYVELLGSGGFADVFRYQQQRPSRPVAVKVLLTGLGVAAQRQFDAEADLMALLSNHPSIVSIYQSGLAGDGRPYLVMELCKPGHLGTRIKSSVLPVARALEIAIQIASAVESAHRLRILHRDIKPANILFTEYDRPALTDFGISVAEGTGPGTAAFSVSWAPPEQIDNRPMGASGDVYSLAATLWAMLAGHGPFDVPRGDNSTLAVAQRVRTQPAPPTGVPGVPESLERILAVALAKDPARRYPSALEFARVLQGVQAELHQSVTTIDVREDRPEQFVDEPASGTRVTGFKSIDPDAAAAPRAATGDATGLADGTRLIDGTYVATQGITGTAPVTDAVTGSVVEHGRGWSDNLGARTFTGPGVPQVPDEHTVVRPGVPVAPTDAAPAPRSSLAPLAWALGVIAIVAVLAGVWLLSGQKAATIGTNPTPTQKPADAVPNKPAQIEDLAGKKAGGTVTFTWTQPLPQTGDVFWYSIVHADGSGTAPASTDKPTATVKVQSGQTCLSVFVKRADGTASDPVTKCVA